MTATIRDWFANLDPAPPRALRDELQRLLAAKADRPEQELPDVCMAVAEATLQRLQTSGSNERGSALTLLSIDALVTYAFEAAANDPARIEPRAAAAMARISALAEDRFRGG